MTGVFQAISIIFLAFTSITQSIAIKRLNEALESLWETDDRQNEALRAHGDALESALTVLQGLCSESFSDELRTGTEAGAR